MRLISRVVDSPSCSEVYVSAVPQGGADARALFEAVNEAVAGHGARVCRARVFVPEGRLEAYQEAWRDVCRLHGVRIPVDWLYAGAGGAVGGVQVHAVSGAVEWQPLCIRDSLVGWAFGQNGCRWVVTGGLTVPQEPGGPRQTRALFEKGEHLLTRMGMGWGNVVRTWIYLDRILTWYGPFNETRNRLFVERGLLRRDRGDAPLVPASTGMGVMPALGGRVALELFAVEGPDARVKRYSAAGAQRSAYEYGSAFARAAELHTPAGRTVFVSGTAAIDAGGATCFADDPAGQIRMTFDNVLAVLRDARCPPKHVVQAIAYCKTPQVAEVFARKWESEVPWPWLVVIGDVCRPDLLFEAEVTACEPTPVGS